MSAPKIAETKPSEMLDPEFGPELCALYYQAPFQTGATAHGEMLEAAVKLFCETHTDANPKAVKARLEWCLLAQGMKI